MAQSTDRTQPKTHRVAETLTQWIAEERVVRGEAIPSEAQLMRELAVSRGTVRRGIDLLVQQGILEPRAGIGHVLRSRTPRPAIGILFGGVFQAYHKLIYEALVEELAACAFVSRTYIGVAHFEGHGLDQTQICQDIQARRLQGLITLSWRGTESERDRRLKALLDEQEIPRVQFSSSDLPYSISADMGDMARRAVRLLAQSGRGRIALMIPGVEQSAEPSSFLSAYCQAMLEMGLAVEPSLLWHAGGRATEQSGHDLFKRYWAQEPRPDALIITDDVLAKGALVAAIDLGIDIPERLRVAALAVKDSDTFYARPIVRLQLDAGLFARTAVHTLKGQLQQPASPRQKIRLPCELVDESGATVGEGSSFPSMAPPTIKENQR